MTTAYNRGLDVLGAVRVTRTSVAGVNVREWDNHNTYAPGDVVYYSQQYWRALRQVDPPLLPALMSGEVPGDSDAWRPMIAAQAEVLGRGGHGGGRGGGRHGSGIRDGRGYGPYGTGYYLLDDDVYLPYGPEGELLPSYLYDYQPGPGGSYLVPDRGAPIKLAPGVTTCDERGNWSRSKIAPQAIVLGMLDIQQAQRNMNDLKPVTVEIAHLLLRAGQETIDWAISTAEAPESAYVPQFVKNISSTTLPGAVARENTKSHLKWHEDNLGKIWGQAQAAYADGDDLKKWVIQAFVEANAVEEGNAYIEKAWNDMWTEIENALARIAKAALNSLGKLAGGIVPAVTGVPTWVWIAGGVATAGLVGFVGYKVVVGPLGRRYLP